MKIRYNLFTLLIVLSLTTGCSLLKKDYPEIAHAITLRTAKILQKEKGMKLVGTGGGMIRQVNSLSMHLNYYSPLEIPEARRLALFTVDKFLHNINSDEAVRPYLNNYPFKVESLRIYLAFYHPNGRSVQPGKLDHIVISNGILKYKSSNNDSVPYSTLFEESVAEARIEASNKPAK